MMLAGFGVMIGVPAGAVDGWRGRGRIDADAAKGVDVDDPAGESEAVSLISRELPEMAAAAGASLPDIIKRNRYE